MYEDEDALLNLELSKSKMTSRMEKREMHTRKATCKYRFELMRGSDSGRFMLRKPLFSSFASVNDQDCIGRLKSLQFKDRALETQYQLQMILTLSHKVSSKSTDLVVANVQNLNKVELSNYFQQQFDKLHKSYPLRTREPTIEFVPEKDAEDEEGFFRITLPPKTKFVTDSPFLFFMMGFTSRNTHFSIVDGAESKLYRISNTSDSDSLECDADTLMDPKGTFRIEFEDAVASLDGDDQFGIKPEHLQPESMLLQMDYDPWDYVYDTVLDDEAPNFTILTGKHLFDCISRGLKGLDDSFGYVGEDLPARKFLSAKSIGFNDISVSLKSESYKGSNSYIKLKFDKTTNNILGLTEPFSFDLQTASQTAVLSPKNPKEVFDAFKNKYPVLISMEGGNARHFVEGVGYKNCFGVIYSNKGTVESSGEIFTGDNVSTTLHFSDSDNKPILFTKSHKGHVIMSFTKL